MHVPIGVGAGNFWRVQRTFCRMSQICPKKCYAANFLPTNCLQR